MTDDTQARPTGGESATATGGCAGPALARLDRPRSDPPVTVAVLADPHVAVDATGTWKVYHRTRARLRTAVTAANARADAAVVAGDLTRNGRPAEFDAVDEVLANLDVPWAAIPGNHDVSKAFDEHEMPPVGAFADRYDDPPFAREVGEVTLLCLDTASADGALRDSWGGRVGERQRAWLADRLAAAANPVVVLHHPVAALPDRPEGPRWRNFNVVDAEDVAACLAAHDAPLVVSAHQHVPAVRSHTSIPDAEGDASPPRPQSARESASDTGTPSAGTVEVLAPATCSFPQASLHVEVDPHGATLRLVPLADRAGVAEAHGLARDGKPLGRTVLELVERRLADLRPRLAGGTALDAPVQRD